MSARCHRDRQNFFQTNLFRLLPLCLQSESSLQQWHCNLEFSFARKKQAMLHFSCDLCGCQLDDRRFVVKLETFPAFDPDQLSPSDLDADHLDQVAQQLESGDAADTDDCETKTLRFDLCPRCHHKFVRDPLGRDAARRLTFSKN